MPVALIQPAIAIGMPKLALDVHEITCCGAGAYMGERFQQAMLSIHTPAVNGDICQAAQALMAAGQLSMQGDVAVLAGASTALIETSASTATQDLVPILTEAATQNMEATNYVLVATVFRAADLGRVQAAFSQSAPYVLTQSVLMGSASKVPSKACNDTQPGQADMQPEVQKLSQSGPSGSTVQSYTISSTNSESPTTMVPRKLEHKYSTPQGILEVTL